jgi:hypothetical protein
MSKVPPYGWDAIKKTTPSPLILDDRIDSKQKIKEKIDAKVDDTVFGESWDDVTDIAPSKNAVYDQINSLTAVADVWTKKTSDPDSNIRAHKTGNYAIGPTNFTSDSDWEKLYLAGNFKLTGNIIGAEGITVGPVDGELTLHSTNGALLPTKFMIGTGTAGVPLEVSLAGTTATADDGTGIIQAGPDSGANLGIGADKIQARSGEAVAELKLNTTGGHVTIGDADSNVTILGDLIVSGDATTLNTATLNVEDNQITLNHNIGAVAPSANSGLLIERGTSTDAELRWNETDDKWQVYNGTTWYDIDADAHAPITLGTNADNALSLSGQELSLADKFVQLGGDTMSAALTIGSASSGAVTNLTVWGDDDSDPDNETVPALIVKGIMQSSAKAFNIEHPLKKGMRLVHGCLEGPEYGVYQRGTLKSNLLIEEIALPEWWKVMVADYTVLLTPHGNYNVWLEEKNKTMFKIKTSADAIDGPWSCEWYVVGRRTDQLLEVEQNANE